MDGDKNNLLNRIADAIIIDAINNGRLSPTAIKDILKRELESEKLVMNTGWKCFEANIKFCNDEMQIESEALEDYLEEYSME